MLTVLLTRKKKRKREERKKEKNFGGEEYVYGTDCGNGLTSVYLSLNSSCIY